MSREYFISDPARPFSDAVLVDGKTLYVSGRLGVLPGTTTVPEAPEEEAHLMLKEFQRALTAAGFTMDDLVQVQIFCSDVSLFDLFNGVYRQYFTGKLPSRAFLGSGSLLFGARFEIMGIAVKG